MGGKLAVVVGGGPAPGINGVISAVTFEARGTTWRLEKQFLRYFEALPGIPGSAPAPDAFAPRRPDGVHAARATSAPAADAAFQAKVDAMVEAYREFGHLRARLDPLGLIHPAEPFSLDTFGLSERECADQGIEVRIGKFPFQFSGRALAAGHRRGAGLHDVLEGAAQQEREREWADADVVELRLPMALRAEAMPDDPSVVAFLFGPIVLAADLGAFRFRILWDVHLRLIAPAAVAAWTTTFVNSVTNLSIAIFLVTPGSQVATFSILGLTTMVKCTLLLRLH